MRAYDKMKTTKQNYTIDKIKTLIDLNNDVTNFNLQFKVTSDGLFQIAIVDHTTMNTTETLPYESVTSGEISGELKWDRNTYQPYYMVLKADKPTEVTVEITLEPLASSLQQDGSQQDTPVTTYKYTYIFLVAAVLGAIAIYAMMRRSGSSSSGPAGDSIGSGSTSRKTSILSKLKRMPPVN